MTPLDRSEARDELRRRAPVIAEWLGLAEPEGGAARPDWYTVLLTLLFPLWALDGSATVAALVLVMNVPALAIELLRLRPAVVVPRWVRFVASVLLVWGAGAVLIQQFVDGGPAAVFGWAAVVLAAFFAIVLAVLQVAGYLVRRHESRAAASR